MSGILRHALNVVRAAAHEHDKATQRSPHWRIVERTHKLLHPTCAACGGQKRVQVHHIKPFHIYPELELVPTNLITLCMGPRDCHLLLGHGDDFKKNNPFVVQCAAAALKDPSVFDVIAARSKDYANVAG